MIDDRRMMRPGLDVTLVAPPPTGRGASAYTVSLVAALLRDGRVGIHISGLDDEGARRLAAQVERTAGGRTPAILLPRLPALLARSPLRWVADGFRSRGSIVHAQWSAESRQLEMLTLLGIARLRRKRRILTVHGLVGGSRLRRLAERLVLAQADHLILHSQEEAAALPAGLNRGRISVIGEGLPRDVAMLEQMPLESVALEAAADWMSIASETVAVYERLGTIVPVPVRRPA